MNIYMLLVSSTAVVLFDLHCAGRFWTSHEPWLSLRTVTAYGLMSTPAGQRRAHLLRAGAANEAGMTSRESMHETWSEKTPRDAAEALGPDGLTVTNQGNKERQVTALKDLASREGDSTSRCSDVGGGTCTPWPVRRSKWPRARNGDAPRSDCSAEEQQICSRRVQDGLGETWMV